MSALELLTEHRESPRHMGKIIGCDTVGDVGSIVVGDALRIFLNIEGAKKGEGLEGAERIAEAKFQAFGAQDMLATASMLCDILPGKTLAEARRLTAQDLCMAFGSPERVDSPGPAHSLERMELPAQIWALEALQVALDQYQGLDTVIDEELKALVCRCQGVSEEQVREAISEDGCRDVEQVTAMTFAGSTCGSCTLDIQRILDDVLKPQDSGAPAAAQKLGGRIPMMRQITEILAQEFTADLQEQGSGVELWDMTGDIVQVKVSGAVSDDAAATEQLLKRIQMRLQDDVAPQLQLESLSK